MHPALLTASGVLAHATHIGLILIGLVGVIALLLPGWRASRAARRTGGSPAWRVPATESEHRARVADLRAAVSNLQ